MSMERWWYDIDRGKLNYREGHCKFSTISLTWPGPGSRPVLRVGRTKCKRSSHGRLRLKCDGTRAETRFRVPVKRTRLFKSAGASVQSTTGSRGVRISGSNAGYTLFPDSVKSTGYPLHSPFSPSLPNPCVTVCHHI